MSPAVLDFRSPVSSSSPPQSKTTSFQNPNPNPKPHTPLHAHSPFGLGAVSSNDRTVNMNSSTVENASESSFGVAFTSPIVSRVGSVKPPPSVRSKPRLTKVRKHLGSQNGKSKTVSDEIDSGFNPFMSVSKSSDRANDGNNTSNVSNGFNAFVGDNKFGKCENVGFVFGANGSDSTVNLDSTKRETSKNVEKLDSFKNGTMKLENEEKGEFGNIGFVFSASKSNLGLNGKIGNGEPGGNVGKTGADNSEKVNINIEAEPRNFDNVEFVIVDNQSDSGVNLSSENRDSSNSVEKPGLDERGKDNIQSEAQCGNHGNIDFVFAANQMTSASNSKEKDCRENAAKFCVDDKHENTIGVEPEVKKYDHVGAVFGSSWSSSASNSNMENLKVRSETEYQKAKTAAVSFDASGGSSSLNGLYGKGVFVFGESSHQSFKFNEGMAAKPSGTDELNKLSSEDFRNCNGIAKSQNGDLGSDPGIAKTEACDLDSGANDSNVASTYSTIPFYKLPDEMRKLNINDLGKINGPDSVKGSDINPSADTKNLSEFGCLNKASSSSTEGSVTTSQIDNSNSNGLENVNTAEKTGDPGFQPNGHDFEESSTERAESRDRFSFTGSPDKSAASSTDFRTPKWDPSSFKENLFPDINRKFDFSPMSRSVKSRRSKKVGRKLRQPRLGKLSTGHDFVQKESTCQENPDSPGSPMDFSPYQETIVANPCSQENSVTSTESFHPENKCATSTAQSTIFQDVRVDPVAVSDGFDISGVNNNCSQTIMDNHGAENAHFKSNADQVCGRSGSGSGVNLAESGVGFSIDTERQANKSKLQFPYASGFEDMNEKSFSFSASSCAQGSLSATKRRYRKKNRLKVGRDTLIITPRSEVETPPPSFQFSPHASPSSRLDAMPSKKGDKPSSQSKEEADKEQVKQRSISSSAAVREACEKWRARGNEAYKNRDLSKAEDCYTRGIKSVPRRETSGCWIEPLVLCYSNRATTRMSLGKIREALGDCMRATALDPNFPKVQMRAANCHLLLGEVENAVQYFSKCLKSGTDVCLDRRIVIEASDGIQKAQKVAACTKQCAELLQQRTSDAASSALTLIEDAVLISPFSEILLEIKAEALFLLRKFEEVIQLCEHTLNFAEKILPSVGGDDELSSEKAHNGKKNAFVRLWRRRLISKSYFHMGRLESALDLLEKEEQLSSLTDMCKSKGPESTVPLAVTIRELLRRKHAGNEAFQAGRHTEALEHYTAALSTNVESRPFAAVCFCNRAAAHQALGQIADAIADCSLAIALDGNYPKAVSRRATLHEMIRDYAQAANDLQRYISILEKQSHEKSKQSGGSGPSGSVKELRQAHRRLSSMEEQSKNDIPLELYLILGIKSSDTASEIKKAYRKAALRHHPDKAGQFLARSESGDDGRLWKEIVTEVHKDADRLFKMINEAYAVLSDPIKRSKYDLEEDMRETLKESNKSSTFRRQPDVNEYPFERRDSRQYWKGTWKTHGNSYSRW